MLAAAFAASPRHAAAQTGGQLPSFRIVGTVTAAESFDPCNGQPCDQAAVLAPVHIGSPLGGLVTVGVPIPRTDLNFGLIDLNFGGVQFLAQVFRVVGTALDTGLEIQVLHGDGIIRGFDNLGTTDEGLSLSLQGHQGTFLIDGYGFTGPPLFPPGGTGPFFVSGKVTNIAPVPEPATAGLLLTGLLPIGVLLRRRRCVG
jgi:hypothetical protein